MPISIRPNLSKIDLLQVRKSLEIIADQNACRDSLEFQRADYFFLQTRSWKQAVNSFQLGLRFIKEIVLPFSIEHSEFELKEKEQVEFFRCTALSMVTAVEEAASVIEEKLRLSLPVGLQKEWNDYLRKNKSGSSNQFNDSPFRRFDLPIEIADSYLYSVSLLQALPEERLRFIKTEAENKNELSFWRNEVDFFCDNFLTRSIRGSRCHPEGVLSGFTKYLKKQELSSIRRTDLLDQVEFAPRPTLAERQLQREFYRLSCWSKTTDSYLFQASSQAVSSLRDDSFNPNEAALTSVAVRLTEHALLMHNIETSVEIESSIENIESALRGLPPHSNLLSEMEVHKPIIPRSQGNAIALLMPNYPFGLELKCARRFQETLPNFIEFLRENLPVKLSCDKTSHKKENEASNEKETSSISRIKLNLQGNASTKFLNDYSHPTLEEIVDLN